MVAITGANGYLGGRIARHLERAGIEPLALVRRPQQWTGPGRARRYALGEPLEPELLADVDVVIHAAYDTRARREHILSANVAGSLPLLEAASARGLRVVLISSLSAFAGSRSLYGRSKLQLEEIVRAHGGFALRPGLVFGAEAGGLFGTLARLFGRAPLLALPAGGGQRQFLTHDGTLARLLELIVTGRYTPERPVFAACETPSSLRAIAAAIAAAHGRSARVIDLPAAPLYLLLRLAELSGLQLPLRSDSLLSLMRPVPLDQVAMLERSPLAFPPLSAELWAR